MTPTREAYLQAARTAVDLLADPAVAESWEAPSALPDFSVRGLAGHLASQILFVPQVLSEPAPAGEPVTLMEHYGRVTWIGADIDAEVNVGIRSGGEKSAAGGSAELTRRTRAAIGELEHSLAYESVDRVVHPPAGPWPMRLDDLLITRMMEIAVHSDDLACSVGVATPALPESVLNPVLALLSALAVRRHGPTAVLRALSRAERAPATITAF
jgi:Mycothiol maleylpyruvate isomerase N-terminal domain